MARCYAPPPVSKGSSYNSDSPSYGSTSLSSAFIARGGVKHFRNWEGVLVWCDGPPKTPCADCGGRIGVGSLLTSGVFTLK